MFSLTENLQNCLTDHAAAQKYKKQLTQATMLSSQTALQKQVDVEKWKKQYLLSTCQNLSCGLKVWFFFIRPFLEQNDAWSTSFTLTVSFELV